MLYSRHKRECCMSVLLCIKCWSDNIGFILSGIGEMFNANYRNL